MLILKVFKVKKIILIVVLSVSTVGPVFLIADSQSYWQESAMNNFIDVGDINQDEDELMEYDEFDRLADTDTNYNSHSMRDYIPGWVKAFGIRVLLTYFAVKEYFSNSWQALKRRLAIVYGAKKMQEVVR